MFNVISEDFSIYKNIPPGDWGVYVSSDFPTRYSYSHLPTRYSYSHYSFMIESTYSENMYKLPFFLVFRKEILIIFFQRISPHSSGKIYVVGENFVG